MKNKHSLTSFFLRSAALGLSLALAACASFSSKTAEDQIKERVAQRWQALVVRDFNRAYSYLTPSFRELVTVEAYRGRFGAGLSWLGGEAVAVNCPEATKCIARVRIDYKPLLSGRVGDKIGTYSDETWLLEGGQWWLFEAI